MFRKLGLLMVAWAAFAVDGGLGFAATELPLPTLSREEDSLARDFKRGKEPPSAAAREALKKETILLISRLTHAAESANYTRIRKDIELGLSERKQSPEARAVIVENLVQYATGISTRDTFLPASRINCVAILAELDDTPEMRVAAGTAPPQPAKAAYPALKGIAGSTKMPYYIRAIALHGLERHARVYWKSDWDDARKKEVVEVATNVISSKPATALDTEAHAWISRRAFDLLTATGAITAASVNEALALVADPKALPSLRLSALNYLSNIDLARLQAERKAAYLVGITHLLRTQLVNWYELEEDKIKRNSNAQSAFGGGMGGMMGGGGEDGANSGSDYGDQMGDMTGAEGGSFDGGDGRAGGGFDAAPKPIDTQDWQTRAARRMLNQVTQTIHTALDGKPLADENPTRATSLAAAAQNDAQLQGLVVELSELIDDVHKAINDPEKIKDVPSLLQGAQIPIENIMDFVHDVPGFGERYPELAEDVALETVPDAPAAGEGEPAASGDAGSDPNAGAPADGTAPAGAAPAGLPGPNGVPGPANANGVGEAP